MGSIRQFVIARLARGMTMLRIAVSLVATFLVFTGSVKGADFDCPLRDVPFSVDLPIMDIMRNDQVKAALQRVAPDLLSRMPPSIASTSAPALSGIMSLRTLSDMGAIPAAQLAELDAVLRAVPVVSADKSSRCERYDDERPQLAIPGTEIKLLVFEKMIGFRDGPSVDAARAMVVELGRRNGWGVVVTDRGGVMTPKLLKQFDAVIWNNVSGDVLTLTQRRAFEQYIDNGGGFVGVHGSAGDFIYFWEWYADRLLGARFIGHPTDPQFQNAAVRIEANPAGIGATLVPGWTMNDEWYSFRTSARAAGSQVIATLDETTYKPVGRAGHNLAMGDHPIAWMRCLGDGRSFYSAIGHRPETYVDPRHQRLLEDAIRWAAGKGARLCDDGRQIPAR
jgi:type 1 glutamine amidotransferase